MASRRFSPESHGNRRLNAMSESTAAPAGFPVLGALPVGERRTAFRVWAPAADAVAVAIGGQQHDLAHAGDGIFVAELAVQIGADYEFVLDGRERWPDPWSRSQPYGLRGPSRVLGAPRLRREM